MQTTINTIHILKKLNFLPLSYIYLYILKFAIIFNSINIPF